MRNLKPGDRVLVSCISACGACRFCREGRFGQCLDGGGWILGHTIDGTQAEKVRVPFADTSTYPVPAGTSDEEFLMLADILPTAYEVGVLNGAVSPGDVVAIVGAGPIGSRPSSDALLFSPSHVIAIDLADSRLEAAKQFGADVTVNNGREDPVAIVQDLTDGLGADVAIEAVGTPATFELATELIRPGGHVANIGVHGAPAFLHLETLWTRDVTITTGLVDTYSTPMLSRLMAAGQLDAGAFCHPSLQVRRVHDGLRRVLTGGGDRGAQGRAHPCSLTTTRHPLTPRRDTMRLVTITRSSEWPSPGNHLADPPAPGQSQHRVAGGRLASSGGGPRRRDTQRQTPCDPGGRDRDLRAAEAQGPRPPAGGRLAPNDERRRLRD